MASRIDGAVVASMDETIVGFIVVHDDELEQMYVDTAARSSGAAAALLSAGERSIARHHSSAWLAVVAGNHRARRFYERNGWRDDGPFDHHAEIEGGTFVVPCRRYVKALQP